MGLKTIGAAISMAAVFTVVGGATASAAEQTNNQKPNAQPAPVVVTIQPGDNLSKIAQAHDTTYVRIFNANESIQDPDVIHPGQNIRIPSADEVLPERPLPAAPVDAPAPAATALRASYSSARTYAPAAANYAAGDTVWDRLAQCESGGNWAISTGNGYSGGLQFSHSTWRAMGGSGTAAQASREEQIARAQALQARSGWGQWPACSAKLGLR